MHDPIREFSAKVSIDLIVGDKTLPVRQSGGDFLILSYPWPLPPSVATLVLTVDEARSETKVYLAEGLRPDRDQHPIVLLNAADA